MPLLMLSNMEKYYPEADKLIPERWLKDGPQSSKKIHPFFTMPFGFGPRCAMTEDLLSWIWEL
jgi:cytochrome P450 family 12